MRLNTNATWQVFDTTLPVLTCEYSFGPSTATALAVRGKDGLIVFSPPCQVGDATFTALDRHGPVIALVATNAFHTMGLAEWKQRFPAAALFAPAQSIARLEKKTNQRGIRPVDAAAPLLGDRLRITDMPHYKTGEMLLRIDSGRGLIWYVTDVIFNFRELPANPVASLVFRLARSAPGLRFNNVAAFLMMRDKRALKRWLGNEWRAAPPRWLIPAHGGIVDFEADAALAQSLLGQL